MRHIKFTTKVHELQIQTMSWECNSKSSHLTGNVVLEKLDSFKKGEQKLLSCRLTSALKSAFVLM